MLGIDNRGCVFGAAPHPNPLPARAGRGSLTAFCDTFVLNIAGAGEQLTS
jgi:hypothetical protein